MKNVYILIAFLMLVSPILAAPKAVTISITDADGAAYFCNPCYYNVVGDFGTTSGQVAVGASSFSYISNDTSDDEVFVTAQFRGFNSSTYGCDITPAATTGSINISAIRGMGKIAYIYDKLDFFWGLYNRQDPASYGALYNYSRSLGYSSVNYYNDNESYKFGAGVLSNELTGYDVIVVGHGERQHTYDRNHTEWQLSASMGIALTAAINSGVNVVINAIVANESSLAMSSFIAQSRRTTGSQLGDVLTFNQIKPFGTAQYPAYNNKAATCDLWSNDSAHYNAVSAFRRMVIYYSAYGENWYADYNAEFHEHSAGDECAAAKALSASMITSPQDFIYIVPSIEAFDDPDTGADQYFYHTPILHALEYLTFSNFNLGLDNYEYLNINVYEGSDSCDIIQPLAGVICCFKGICGTSSAVTNTTIPYESRIKPIKSPYSAALDLTDEYIYYASELEYDGNWKNDYENLYDYAYDDEQRWIYYSDFDTGRTRISFAGIKGANTLAEAHYFMAYDFYNTYVPIDSIISDSAYVETNYTGGSLDFNYWNWYLFVPVNHVLHTCETGDNWQLLAYAGYNDTYFDRFNMTCKNGVLSDALTRQLGYTGDDITNITWLAGNAPDFKYYSDAEIGYNDTDPIKFIQRNEYNNAINEMRRLIIVKFSHAGTAQDTGGYIDMVNTTLNYDYYRFYGGNITLYVGSGTDYLTCYAPPGYAFYNPVNGTYSASYSENISVFEPVTKAVRVQELKDLTLKLKITSADVEVIDNAICHIDGVGDRISTGGYCVYNDVKPTTTYNITIRTLGAEQKIVYRKFTTGDYYDSNDADQNLIKCGLFDGTWTYPIWIDRDNLELHGTIYAYEDSEKIRVGNANVNVDGVTDKADSNGNFILFLEYKAGGSYQINITKRPQILDFSDTFMLSEINCMKEDICHIEVIVLKNSSYDGSINDDVIYGGYDPDDITSAIGAIVNIITSPFFMGFVLVLVTAYVGMTLLGGMGAIFGFFGGTILAIAGGFLAPEILLLFILIGIIAVAVAGLGLFN